MGKLSGFIIERSRLAVVGGRRISNDSRERERAPETDTSNSYSSIISYRQLCSFLIHKSIHTDTHMREVMHSFIMDSYVGQGLLSLWTCRVISPCSAPIELWKNIVMYVKEKLHSYVYDLYKACIGNLQGIYGLVPIN